jgi:hypothetical protein
VGQPPFRLIQQIRFLNEQKLRTGIDEFLNQPGTRNAINFDVFACNPFYIHLTVAKRM